MEVRELKIAFKCLIGFYSNPYLKELNPFLVIECVTF